MREPRSGFPRGSFTGLVSTSHLFGEQLPRILSVHVWSNRTEVPEQQVHECKEGEEEENCFHCKLVWFVGTGLFNLYTHKNFFANIKMLEYF